MKNMAGVTPAVLRSAFAVLKRVQLQQCVSTAKLWLKSKKSKWVLKPNLLHKKRSPAAPFFYVYFRVNKTQRSQVAGRRSQVAGTVGADPAAGCTSTVD